MTRRRRVVSTPVVLPHITIRSDGVGTMAVTVDGQPVSDVPVPLVQLGEAISQIIDQLGTAVRVEIHDPDGTIHTDILTPHGDQPDTVGVTTGTTRIRESA